MAFTVQFLLFLTLGARGVVLMCSLSQGGLFFLTVQILSLPPYSLFSELPIVLLLLGVNVCWCLKVVNHSLADNKGSHNIRNADFMSVSSLALKQP